MYLRCAGLAAQRQRLPRPEYGREAAALFADKLANGELPGVRTIRETLPIGRPKAMKIRKYLSVLATGNAHLERRAPRAAGARFFEGLAWRPQAQTGAKQYSSSMMAWGHVRAASKAARSWRPRTYLQAWLLAAALPVGALIAGLGLRLIFQTWPQIDPGGTSGAIFYVVWQGSANCRALRRRREPDSRERYAPG
jgi:hypothetical protein